MANKVNIAEKLASFNEHWSPKIVGELNGQYVKVVKFKGEYVWHHHDNEDELFLVIRGGMEIHLSDSVINLSEGEFYIVPRGVEHKPVAAEECHALLFEPATTRNTGNVDHKYTIEPDDLEKL
ncbi:MAG: cupin domain-containing protein [candidate division Zixibacteria bacterium]